MKSMCPLCGNQIATRLTESGVSMSPHRASAVTGEMCRPTPPAREALGRQWPPSPAEQAARVRSNKSKGARFSLPTARELRDEKRRADVD